MRRSLKAIHWPVGAVLLLAAAGCEQGFFHAPAGHGSVAIAASFSGISGGAGTAYDKADALAVRLAPVDGQGSVTVRELPFTPASPSTRVRIELDLADQSQAFDVSAELRANGSAVFTGQTQVTLTSGSVTEATVSLQPVLAGVAAPEPLLIDELGATAQLEGAGLFATGDTVEGVPLSWRVTSQSGSTGPVVTLTADGLVRAVGEGVATIQVSSGGFTDQTTVTVEATVASVLIEPDEVALQVDEHITLVATATDAGGNVLERVFEWSSDLPSVATVDDTGFVTGISKGQALITAAAGGVSGTAFVEVFLPVPTVATGEATNVSTGARLNGSVNPNGLPTDAWFEWGLTPGLESFFETPIRFVGNGTTLVTITDDIPEGTLAASTRYYYRVVAENDAGFVLGEVRDFMTPPAPVVGTDPPVYIEDSEFGIFDIVFRGNAETFGFPARAWFEFSDDAKFNTVGGSTLAQDLSPSSGLIPFQERLPQSAFQCCVTIYVRAVVSTVMGKTEAEPRSFAIAGFGAGQAGKEADPEAPGPIGQGGGPP